MAKASKPIEQDKRTEPATFRLKPDILKKLKYIAFTDDTKQTDIVEKSLEEFIVKWEKKHGEIPVK
jgi:hypothetical protein